jgi:hypothetical protein
MRFLSILVISFLLSGNALSEPAHFLCKKNKKLFSDGEYPLMVDIDKKKMIRAYTEYEMKISEGYLTGIHNENQPYEIRIVLNRYNLELNVNFFNDGAWNFSNSYKTSCRKVEKKI